MNHNLLISKYLDGDLSHDEDSELRRLLSEHSEIKEEFDAATMVHFLMKEDAASMEIPVELFDSTEKLISAKFEDLPSKVSQSGQSLATKKTRNFSSAVAILLLLMVLPFSDESFIYSSGNAESTETTQDVQLSPQSTLLPIRRPAGRGIHHANSSSVSNRPQVSLTITAESQESANFSSAGNDSENSTESTVLGNASIAFANEAQSQTEQGTSTPAPQSRTINSYTTVASSLPTPSFRSLLPVLKSDGNNQTDIQVNTFVSTMITLPENHSNTTANISQSIAYSLGDNNRVGVEIGYFGYSYQDGGTFLVSKSTTSQLSNKILGMDDPSPGANDASAERTSSSMTNSYEEKKVAYSIDKNMYWGAAFYEHTLLNTGNVSFNGRLGVGGSTDGPMAYTRAYAKYNVYSDIAFTLGAEASSFIVHAPLITGKTIDFTTGFSFVYGMQIKF